MLVYVILSIIVAWLAILSAFIYSFYNLTDTYEEFLHYHQRQINELNRKSEGHEMCRGHDYDYDFCCKEVKLK